MSRFKLPQKVTYWLPLVNNGTGGKTWTPGAVVPARIADNNDTVFTIDGKQQSAKKAVYTRTEIPTGSQIVEGENQGAVNPVTDAQLVIKASSNKTMNDMYRALV